MRGEYINGDCMDYLPQYEDNHFDLAIVDPPYGINFGEYNRTNKTSNGVRYKANKYKQSGWDEDTPNNEYFKQLLRVSKNQIVWGGNYFPYLWQNGCRCFIYWHKGNPVQNFSDGELAFTSFDSVAKQFNYRYYGGLEGNSNAGKKYHPTQKPIALYKWLLTNYANEGDLILDTHVGSASSLIACEDMKFDYVGFELDKEYYNDSMKRLQDHIKQLTLF